MQVIRRAMLEFHQLDFTTRELLKTQLTIPNPAYQAAVMFRRGPQNISKEILLYKETQDVLCVPRNLKSDLSCKILRSARIIDQGVSAPIEFGETIIEFRHYQQRVIKNVVTALNNGTIQDGIIVAPAGSGKTTMLLEIARQLKQKTLWLTDEVGLAKQTLKRAKDQFGIQGALWGGGKKQIAPFTVAIYDSLQNEATIDQFADEFGLIIIDECHTAPATTYSKVLNRLNAKYRLGTTATPKRKDRLESIMHQTLGPIIEHVTREDLKEFLVTSKVWFVKSDFKTKNTSPAGIERAAFRDAKRNQLIVDKIIWAVRQRKHKALVLTGTKVHTNLIKRLLLVTDNKLIVEIVTSNTPYEERETIYERARRGEVDVLIAVRIARKGLDIEVLSALFKIRPSNNEPDLEQEVGRISRYHINKPEPEVFDFVDVNVDLYLRQALQRLEYYKEMKCEFPTNEQV